MTFISEKSKHWHQHRKKIIKPGAVERSDCLSNWKRVRAIFVNTLDFN